MTIDSAYKGLSCVYLVQQCHAAGAHRATVEACGVLKKQLSSRALCNQRRGRLCSLAIVLDHHPLAPC